MTELFPVYFGDSKYAACLVLTICLDAANKATLRFVMQGSICQYSPPDCSGFSFGIVLRDLYCYKTSHCNLCSEENRG